MEATPWLAIGSQDSLCLCGSGMCVWYQDVFPSLSKALLGSFLLKPPPVACPLYRIRGDRVWSNPLASKHRPNVSSDINLACCDWLPRPFACVIRLTVSGGWWPEVIRYTRFVAGRRDNSVEVLAPNNFWKKVWILDSMHDVPWKWSF
jgi:hypothetical protein